MKQTLRFVVSTSLVFAPIFALAASSAEYRADINRIASMPLTSPKAVKITTNNQVAFTASLAMARMAKPGERLVLMYYIHNNDEAASRLNEEVLKAAKRGVHVDIMADFITNYGRIDMFNMLARESGGNINVRFYGLPTSLVHEDLIFMSTPCGNSANCVEEKDALVKRYHELNEKNGSRVLGEGTFFSKLMLAGISAKSGGTVKAVMAQTGALESTGAQKPSAEDKEQLAELGKLVYHAKFEHDIVAKLKLQAAMIMYGDKLGPIMGGLQRNVPLDNRPDVAKNNLDLEYLTEFTHHKVFALFRQNGEVIIRNGGRNFEKSYFLNESQRGLVDRYLFADTDAVTQIQEPAARNAMQTAIDRLFNYAPKTASLADVSRILPGDFVMNPDAVAQTLADVKSTYGDVNPTNVEDVSDFAERRFRKLTAGRADARIQAQAELLRTNSDKYRSFEASKNEGYYPKSTLRVNLKQDPDAKVAYFENLPFVMAPPEDVSFWHSLLGDSELVPKRVHGSNPREEAESGKNIHALWVKTLHQVAAAAEEKFERTGVRSRLYIHQGYVLLPSVITETLGQMIRGEIPSSSLEVVIVTNGIETTDLSPINMIARHQFKALFDYLDHNRRFAKDLRADRQGSLGALRIFEQQKFPDGSIMSLHTKAMYADNMMLVGSANAEGRSMSLDTNNLMLVIDAPTAAGQKMREMDALLKNTDVVKEVTEEYRKSHAQIVLEDKKILEKISERPWAKSMRPRMPTITRLVAENAVHSYFQTGYILDPSGHANEWLGVTTSVSKADAKAILEKPNASGGGGGAGGATASVVRCEAIFAIEKSSAPSSQALKSLEGKRVEAIRQSLESVPQLELMKQWDRSMMLL